MTTGVFSSVTTDGKTWSVPTRVQEVDSKDGLRMVLFGFNIYGFYTNSNNLISWTQYNWGKEWTKPVTLPTLYKAVGPVSVVSWRSRCYVVYRGTNDGIYMMWTSDFEHWNDLGRIGSNDNKTVYSPAIGFCPVGREEEYERLICVSVGAHESIYYTFVNEDGASEPWIAIPGSVTEHAPSVSWDGASTHVYWTELNRTFFYRRQWDRDEKFWKLPEIIPADIYSSPSVIGLGPRRYICTYRTIGQRIAIRTGPLDDLAPQTEIKTPILGETGMCLLGDSRTTCLSYSRELCASVTYETPAQMCEERSFDEKGEMWDCKWQEEKGSKKSVSSFFCCD